MAKHYSNLEAVPYDLRLLEKDTENVYKTIAILAKRANQISQKQKEELNAKLADFAPVNDNLEEFYENKEQIELSVQYEKLPKPSSLALTEFLNDEIYFKEPELDTNTNSLD
jgi:DNA-directed RNA polymerase subunit K/omega